MFTGIVEETGEVLSIGEGENSIRLAVKSRIVGHGLKLGDSLAVNGCCLTLVKARGRGAERVLEFDLLRETWNRTNLQFVKTGTLVNLERSLAADGRLHGHFVTGHIDGMGEIRVFEQRGKDYYLSIAAPKAVQPYLVFKGAVAVDGISLTVAEVKGSTFGIWIIPHTRSVTALKDRRAGDRVNIEADLLAKYTAELLRKRTPGKRGAA